MIAVHGWLDNCATFLYLGAALARVGCHVLAVDLPGHGLSDHLPPGQVSEERAEKHYILRLGLLYHDMDNVLLLHRCITSWDRVKHMSHSQANLEAGCEDCDSAGPLDGRRPLPALHSRLP